MMGRQKTSTQNRKSQQPRRRRRVLGRERLEWRRLLAADGVVCESVPEDIPVEIGFDFGDAPSELPIRLADLNPGPEGSSPTYLSVVQEDLYFSARVASGEQRSFRFDPESNTLFRLPGVRNAGGFQEFEDKVSFFASDRLFSSSAGLFLYDPLTDRVTELIPGPADAGVTGFTEYQGKLYMRADGADGRELFRFDPTTGVYEQFADILPGSASSSPSIEVLNDTLIVRARGAKGIELYRLDTTTDSLVEYDINPNGNSIPNQFTAYRNDIYFNARGPSGSELYRLNGSDNTVEVAAEIDPSLTNVFGPNELGVFDDKLYFTANSGNGTELHRFDATTGLFEEVADISEGDSFPKLPTQVGDQLYFNARGEDGFELHVLDLSTDEVTQVEDLFHGPGDSSPNRLTLFQDKLYFSADSGNGFELHVLDPATQTIRETRDLNPGSSFLHISSLTALGDRLFFRATGEIGSEIFELAQYPTLFAEDGARHSLRPDGPSLGASVNAELDGQPQAAALGDDVENDGVEFAPSLLVGSISSVTVTVTDPSAAGGYLDGWVDWNRDGDWEDPGEKIIDTIEVGDGANTLDIAIPNDAIAGPTFARIRLSTSGELEPTGFASDGEVEDYRVHVNRAPVAVDDVVFTSANQPLSISVLERNGDAADSDPSDDPLAIESASQPEHGSVDVTSAATIRYRPATDFVGADTFQYTIQDGKGATATAQVTVNVSPFGTIAVDNLSSRFSTEGGWSLSSSVSGFVGSNYRHAFGGDSSAIFRPIVADEGLYEVFANWTSHPNRATNAAIEITHRDGMATVAVDQTQGGGEFHSLGVFPFAAGRTSSIEVRTAGADGVVVADGIQLVPFNGVIEVDNSDREFSIETGVWGTGRSVPGFVGENYRHAPPGKNLVGFTPFVAADGPYEVFATWTSHPNRATNATFKVFHADGSTVIEVDQTQNGGQFQSLGTYRFGTGDNHSVTLSAVGADGIVIADAIRLVPLVPAIIELDNAGPNFIVDRGEWKTSSAIDGFVAANYDYAAPGENIARFTPSITFDGTYEVLANWTSHPNRASNVAIEIAHDDGTDRVVVDQTLGGGVFQSLGEYAFVAGGSGSITFNAIDADGLVVADAIRLVRRFGSSNTLAEVKLSIASYSDSDVTRDHQVTPLDALMIINFLSTSTPDREFAEQYDVNRDERVSTVDALWVINEISRKRSANEMPVAGSASVMSSQMLGGGQISTEIEEDALYRTLF